MARKELSIEEKEEVLARASVLVVDDARTVRHLISSTLRDMKVRNIREAGDPVEALSILEAGDYSLVISDWEMPKMSGIEFISKIREQKRWANLPFLMVTGKNRRQDIDEALEAEVSDVIPKPFPMGELQEKVERILIGQSRAVYEQLSLLIVDDAPTVQHIVQKMAAELGFGQVYAASNGIEALELLKEKKVDIVFSDWEMPQMTGIELLKAVRAMGTRNSLPFIIVTSRTESESVLEAIKAGVTSYIAKPFDINVFQEKLDSALLKEIR